MQENISRKNNNYPVTTPLFTVIANPSTRTGTPQHIVSSRTTLPYSKHSTEYNSLGISENPLARNVELPSIKPNKDGTYTVNNATKKPLPRLLKIPSLFPDTVYIAFFKHGNYSMCNPINWLIQKRLKCISPKYEHCQIIFCWNPGTDKQVLATFSTNKTNPSTYTNPSYTNEKWNALPIVSINGSEQFAKDKRARLMDWCKLNERVPFNACAYYCNFIPPIYWCPLLAYDADGSAYFCAEQVASALRALILPEGENLVPHVCVPDDIYNSMIDLGSRPILLHRPSLIQFSSTFDKFNIAGGGQKMHLAQKNTLNTSGSLCNLLSCCCCRRCCPINNDDEGYSYRPCSRNYDIENGDSLPLRRMI